MYINKMDMNEQKFLKFWEIIPKKSLNGHGHEGVAPPLVFREPFWKLEEALTLPEEGACSLMP